MSELHAMDQDENAEIDPTLDRARELNRDGLDWGHAWGKAWLERRIADWPSGWGDDLQILLYGDFDPPDDKLNFPGVRNNSLSRQTG